MDHTDYPKAELKVNTYVQMPSDLPIAKVMLVEACSIIHFLIGKLPDNSLSSFQNMAVSAFRAEVSPTFFNCHFPHDKFMEMYNRLEEGNSIHV